MDLDSFCGEQFWNESLTWFTEDPELTKCFEKTVLIWIPCIYLWIFSPIDIYDLLHSKKWNVPWNWLNMTKLGLTGISVLVLIAEVFIIVAATFNERNVYPVDFYAPIVKGLTVAYSGVLVFYNRKYGMNTSGLLFFFWFLLLVCGVPQFRTEIRTSQNNNVPDEFYGIHVTYLIYYVIVMVMFLLNCWSDQQPEGSEYPKQKKPCPEQSAGFLSRLVFAWFDRLVLLGYKKPLEMTDLWDIPFKYAARGILPVFEKHWKKSLERSKRKNTRVSFLPALFKTFGGMFLFGAFFKLVNDLMIFISPNLLGYIITFVQEKQEMWKGFFYAVLLFVSATAKTFVSQQFFNRNFIIGMKIRSALISLIYKKSLTISNMARKERTTGEIVNLMSVDAQRFGDVGNTINILWSAPLQIGLSTYFLWQELGPSVLAGFTVLLLLFPINAVVANISKKLHLKNMKNRDERVKLMNELLSGIRVLKLYAWEKSFEDQVTRVRTKELKTLRRTRYLHAFNSFVMHCTPFMVALTSFTTYVLVDERNILDAKKAFVSLSLFNIIRGPLLELPMLITNLLQMFVSVKRLNDFLNAEDMNPESVHHEVNKEYPITIEKGTFSWGDDPILKDVNLCVKANTLTAVVGTVGAGKSSLLSAILGEMVKMNGKVNTYGKIAYVSQQAWIQNATLRDNIIFGNEFVKEKYDKVIEACALKADLEILPGGDHTEIGEKGINLSGGQKQRVSLARAVYTESDIYLLDDPLSAVDSHVGKHIFDNVIGPKGLLKHKTKLLNTHAVTYLSRTDQIVVIKNGHFAENGTFQELLNKKGDFAEFLLQHISNNNINDEDLEELKHQVGDTPFVEEVEKRYSRQNSSVSFSRSEGKGSEFQSNTSVEDKKPTFKGKESRGKQANGMAKNKIQPPRRGEKLIEKENAEVGQVKWDIYKYYLKNIGSNMILLIFGIAVITQIFGIGSNAWLGEWSDDESIVVDGVVNTGKRNMYLGVYGVIGFSEAITVILINVVYTIATLEAAAKIHKNLLENTLRLPMVFFDTTPIGRILGRFSSDMMSVDNMLPNTFQMVLGTILRVIGTLAVITYTTPLIMTVVVPLSVIYYIIQRFYIASSRQLRRLLSVSRSPLYSHFGETLTGLSTIRAYNQQKRFISECYRRVDQNQVCQFPDMTAHRWLAIRLENIGNVIIFFTALFAVLTRDQSSAMVGLSVTYALQITQTLKMLVNMASNVETNIVAVERIKEYQDNVKEAAWEKTDQAPKLWPNTGALEFKNYSVRYREGLDLVLKDLNICIKPGEKVGVVGRTGAGKSSMTLGLFRLIEASEGEIRIDDVNIADLGLHKLRSALTIIPQDPVLFAGTLRINVDPFNVYSDEELWRALELAHLKDFVKGLPAGLQHAIAEGGQNLSVGQKQLICLARALLRKTKILVLDEATASIDLETDDLTQKTIRTAFKDCTVLTIAHRLNTIMDSDRIIVLEKGKIVEFDSPTNLVTNTDSVFYGMHKNAGLS